MKKYFFCFLQNKIKFTNLKVDQPVLNIYNSNKQNFIWSEEELMKIDNIITKNWKNYKQRTFNFWQTLFKL